MQINQLILKIVLERIPLLHIMQAHNSITHNLKNAKEI